MQTIVVLGGLGDVYLVASLYESFCRQHRTDNVELVIKSGHVGLVDLFKGVRYRVDDIATFGTEANQAFQRSYENIIGNGQPFYAHPCMVRNRIKLDHLPTQHDVTHADMFRMVLGLDPQAPLSLPRLPNAPPFEPNTVMIVEATTWPNTQPSFYPRLVAALYAAGRKVWVNDKKLGLHDLLAKACATEWVIGPQCGLMSVFVTGQWPCRKTLATPDIDGGRAPAYWAKDTFPYASVAKFAGFDFDVEEYKITDLNHDELIGLILDGANARRLRLHDPSPICSVKMPLTPGDFLDRFAVLIVKRMRFGPEKRALIEREYQRHAEAGRFLLRQPGLSKLLSSLVDIHAETFDVLEDMVPKATGGRHNEIASDQHVKAMRLNKLRMGLKGEIDAACHSGSNEVKSYYVDKD